MAKLTLLLPPRASAAKCGYRRSGCARFVAHAATTRPLPWVPANPRWPPTKGGSRLTSSWGRHHWRSVVVPAADRARPTATTDVKTLVPPGTPRRSGSPAPVRRDDLLAQTAARRPAAHFASWQRKWVQAQPGG